MNSPNEREISNFKKGGRMKPKNIKKVLANRNLRNKTKRKLKQQGIQDYYAQRMQDSQNFSRRNRDKVTESIAKASGLFSPDDPEPFEYKPIDSQVGPLNKQRDYTVDRAQMRNQRAKAGLASLMFTPSGADSGVSPNPRRPLLNDSMMIKSTASPPQISSTNYNAQSMVGAFSGRPGVASPGKDSRNIKLDPINKCKSILSLNL